MFAVHIGLCYAVSNAVRAVVATDTSVLNVETSVSRQSQPGGAQLSRSFYLLALPLVLAIA